jgi:hypothetical protein
MVEFISSVLEIAGAACFVVMAFMLAKWAGFGALSVVLTVFGVALGRVRPVSLPMIEVQDS